MELKCNDSELAEEYILRNSFLASEFIPEMAPQLRARLERDGYLFFPGFFPGEEILELREAYFSLFKDSSPTVPYGTLGHPAHAFVRSSTYLNFTRQKKIQDLADALLGENAVLLPRKILRHFDRSVVRASRAHIDYAYLSEGGSNLLSLWVPLGDCPIEAGGIIYLDESHALDHSRVKADLPEGNGAPWLSSDLGKVAARTGKKWRAQDFRAGDLVLHHPFLVHATLNCLSPADRLSTDIRFVAPGERWDQRWAAPWSADDGY